MVRPWTTYKFISGVSGARRDRTHDRAYNQEPDDYVHDLGQLQRILAFVTMICDTSSQILSTDVEIEDGRDTNWTKEAYEPGLFQMLNLVNMLVHGHNNREASEEKNGGPEKDETPDWNDAVVSERMPWAHRSKPDEDTNVQEHVYGWLKRVIECLLSEPVAMVHVSSIV